MRLTIPCGTWPRRFRIVIEDQIINIFWASGNGVERVSPLALLRSKGMTSVALFAGWCVEDFGDMMKDCVGVMAGFGRRKFLSVVRV